MVTDGTMLHANSLPPLHAPNLGMLSHLKTLSENCILVQDFTLDMENVSISPKGFFALKLITLIGTTKKGPRECPGHPQ